jgi:mRNA-degrading endonuclease toxin of MazEF toxin-antitoxin module
MNPQRGEIYLVPFGQGKPRPVVIISHDVLNGGDYVIVVPFTSQKLDVRKGLQSCVFFNAREGGLDKDCVAKADEIQRISKTEIDWRIGRIGRFSSEQMRKIVRAVRFVIQDEELVSPKK